MTKKKSTAKKATAVPAAKKTAEEQARASRISIEVFGVVLVAIGALFSVYLYSGSQDWLGTIISSFLLGMNGMFGYAMPVLLILIGLLIILTGRKSPIRGSIITGVLAFYFVICVFHLTTSVTLTQQTQVGAEGYTFGDYFTQYFKQYALAWNEGVEQGLGGGVLGMFLTAILYVVGGKVLCWVVSVCGIVVCTLFCTGISIKAYTDAFGSKVKEKIEQLEQDREHWEEDDPAAPKPKRDWKNFAADASTDDAPPRTSAPKKTKHIPFDEEFTVPAAEPKPQTPVEKPKAADPQFLPTTGRIKRTEDDVLVIPPKTEAEPAKPVKKAEPKPNATADDLPLPTADVKPAQPIPLYLPPSLDCLNKARETFAKSAENPHATARLLEETLESFQIGATVVNISIGPVVTRYELQPAPGVRVSRITALSNDIALALAAPRVRIEAPIPGKAAVGIEVPNKDAATVLLRDIVESDEFQNSKSTVSMALGKDIAGKIIVADLGKMPHMLIAGATGSGKSVCINDLIISMIYKSSPQDLQLILIDPKMVELNVYGTLPHLLIPVVTEPKKAASALRWAVNEMTTRYKKFSESGARELARYNALMDDPKKRIPKLVIIIDELADLMMVAADDVEDSICRIAQLGRAAGIHLIVATQRPSADIITGLIKANIPSRCAFAVSSAIDSRIILDATGAEKLLGRGDMLFHPNGAGKPTRLQCAFVSDEEVDRVMAHFKKDAAQFDHDIVDEINNEAKGGAQGGVFGEGKQEDELLGEAVRVVLDNGQASISMIQRRLRVGYARAARLVDMMEQKKYVSGFDGSKPRQVLITRSEFDRIFGDGGDPEAEPMDAADDTEDPEV